MAATRPGWGRFATRPAGPPGQAHGTVNPPAQQLGPSTATGLPAARLRNRAYGRIPAAPPWPPHEQGNNPLVATAGSPPQLPGARARIPQVSVAGVDAVGTRFDGPNITFNTGGVFFANDALAASDRHAFFKTGTEKTGRKSGQTDPPMDGPARPSLAIVNRTINFQQGSDATAAQDDQTRNYSRNSLGMYVGEQGSGWSPVYGGVPGLYQPYGSYAGITSGTVQGIQSPVAQGSVGDGPRRVFSGPPHGLHTQTLPDYTQTLGRYVSTAQMRPPRIDRPSNSPIAGQSYSQLVIPQGWTGSTATRISPAYGRARQAASGWKGRA